MTDQHDVPIVIRLGLTDIQRRRIRAGFMSRSGVATRREIRVWVELLVRDAIEQMPDSPRKPDAAPTVEHAARIEQRAGRISRAKAAAEGAICKHCKKSKDGFHGRMGFACVNALGKTFEEA